MAFGGKLCYLMFHMLWQNLVHVYVIVLKIVIFHVDLHFFADQLRVAENAQAGAFENVPHTVGVDILDSLPGRT